MTLFSPGRKTFLSTALISVILLAACAALNFYSVQLFYSGEYHIVFYLRVVLYIFILIISLLIWESSVAYKVIFSSLVLAEIFFATRFRSANEPYDISSANFAWFNNHGLVGDTIRNKTLLHQPVTIFNGDSYGFGSGLSDLSQGYAHIISTRMRNLDPVVNLAQPGSEIYGQYLKMNQYSKPTLIIHQCNITDLTRPCIESGYSQPSFQFLKNYPIFLRNIIRLSATAQYFAYGVNQSATYNDFYKYYLDCGNRQETLQKLAGYTDSIINYARKKNARLIFVLIPSAYYPEQPNKYIDFLEKHFHVLDVEYIDTTPLLSSIPISERIISKNDHHLSSSFHRRLADLIMDKINSKRHKDVSL